MRFRLFHSLSKEDKALKKSLQNILGFKPRYMPFYVTALTHRSANTEALNNERLEFLGDAFIGSIVGEYLFKKYPTQDEGYLTEMRSKIVSRQSLNAVAIKMGLQKLVRFNHQDRILKRSHIFGNALEALVGAIYLDQGYATTNTFIKKKLIGTFLDIDELEQTEFNFKNRLYTWAQKNHYSLEFNTIKESFEAGRKIFYVGLFVNNQLFIEASGYSKKEASQTAAQKALETIETSPDVNFSFKDTLPLLSGDIDAENSDALIDDEIRSTNEEALSSVNVEVAITLTEDFRDAATTPSTDAEDETTVQELDATKIKTDKPIDFNQDTIGGEDT